MVVGGIHSNILGLTRLGLEKFTNVLTSQTAWLSMQCSMRNIYIKYVQNRGFFFIILKEINHNELKM